MAALQKRCVACPTLMSIALLAGLPVESAMAQVTGSCEPTWLAPMTTNPYSPSPGTVAATTWDPDGDGPLPPELVLAGTMTGAGSTQVNGIARFDGTTWKGFPKVFSAGIEAIAAYDGTLIAMSRVLELSRDSSVFRWNGSAWVRMDASYLGTGLGLSVAGGDLWCGSTKGIFRWATNHWESVGGTIVDRVSPIQFVVFRGQIYALGNVVGTATGVLSNATTQGVALKQGSSWLGVGDADVTSSSLAAAVWRDDIVVAGTLTRNGTSETGLLAFNGSTWRVLDSGPVSAAITSMIVDGDDLIATGSWGQIVGGPSEGIARFDGTTWHSLGAGIKRNADPAVRLVVEPRGDLIVTGISSAGGTTVRGIARWDGTAWHAMIGGFNTAVSSVAVVGDDLYAGGGVSTTESFVGSDVSRWDGTQWVKLPPGGPSSAYALLADNGMLYAGGSTRLARWDGSSWTEVDAGGGDVTALARSKDAVIAAGHFKSTLTGVGYSRLARVDGTTIQPFNDGLNADVYAIAEFRGEMVVGGTFTATSGFPPKASPQRVARWDGTRAVPLRTGPTSLNGLNGPVYALATFGDSLIIAGRFNLAGGTPAKSIARWDGTTFTPMGDGFDAGTARASVYDVKVINGELYAAGDFTLSGSRDIKRLARWDGTAWQPVAGGVSQIQSSGSPTAIYSLASYQGGLAVGGVFDTLAGTIATSNVALLGRPCPPCPADFDNDGFITMDDFDAFVTAFEHGSGRADQDGDGILTFEDFDAFIAAFEQGC